MGLCLCWLLASSAQICEIKQMKGGVSCYYILISQPNREQQDGQIPSLASKMYPTLDKTCYSNADFWLSFRSTSQPHRPARRKCAVTPTVDRSESASQATCAD